MRRAKGKAWREVVKKERGRRVVGEKCEMGEEWERVGLLGRREEDRASK